MVTARHSPASTVFIIFAGLFALCAAVFDWDWFFQHRKAQFLVGLLGRPGARVLYGVLGLGLTGLGIALQMGVLH